MKERDTETVRIQANSREELQRRLDDATRDRVVYNVRDFSEKDKFVTEVVRSAKNYLVEG